MNRVLSTHLNVNHRLTVNWLEKAHRSGIPAVEIFCARQHLDYRDKAQITELGHWFRDSDLTLHSLHAPMYNDDVWGRSGPQAVVSIASLAKADRIRNVDEIKRALEVAETIPFKYLVQHIGNSNEEYSDYALESAFCSLEELSVFARQRGVEVLIENIPNGLSTAERLNHFLGVTHLDLKYVFDVGHAHMGAGVEHEFELMKDRIRSLHVHDNDGTDDKHLFPTVSEGGTVDWARTMGLLRSRPNQYPLLLELKEVPDMEFPLDHVSRVFENLEKA